jgi:hypothetical protein
MYNTLRIGVNVPLIIAGAIALLAACIHGAAGELLVVRRLSPETLPSSRFGGPRMTRAMIHVSWHIATIAFLTTGVAMLLSGTILDGDAARGIALVAAGAFTGFAAVTLGLGAAGTRSPRSTVTHPGPAILTATAVLAWVGALSA